MPLIGTAGHVDHGKSTLVERITGRDPDRWVEEKRRGLTIDLGFAWTELPGGTEVSFVDVPGHERYLKNMLAGIEAIDVALLVVASDEGWMPQSEEHLAVLDLLEVSSGVVALTKTDMVDNDLIELAALEVADHLAGSCLEDARIIAVSATTGDGVDDLLDELQHLSAEVEPVNRDRPRLWVDRSFTASGAGTIVTGTLLDGPLQADDLVMIYPTGLEARIRGLQSHERSLTTVEPGRRVAINLAGVEQEDVGRGHMIGRPGQWELSDRVSAHLRTARYMEKLDRRGSYQIHLGSTVDQVEILALEGEVCLLKLRNPQPTSAGDRFVIRDTGRRLVVAGGRVLDPSPGRARRAIVYSNRIDPELDPDSIATALLETRGIDSSGRLSRHSGGGVAAGNRAGPWVVSDDVLQRLTDRAVTRVRDEHLEHPLRQGLPVATLSGFLGVSPEITEMIIETSEKLIRSGPDVSISGREVEITPEAAAEWTAVQSVLETNLAVPTVQELDLDSELLHLKIRNGELVRVSQDLVFLPSQIERIGEILRSMPPQFTVADFRDAAGLSRKYAVPVLEWADREGLTVRRGDTRTVR